MRSSLIVLATLAPVLGFAMFASSAGAAAVMADPTNSETVATACAGGSGRAIPLDLNLIPSKPIIGHQSVRGVGDDDGCGGRDEGGEMASGDDEGAGGSDD